MRDPNGRNQLFASETESSFSISASKVAETEDLRGVSSAFCVDLSAFSANRWIDALLFFQMFFGIYNPEALCQCKTSLWTVSRSVNVAKFGVSNYK